MPQSGAMITSSGRTYLRARRILSTTVAGDSTVMSDRSMAPTMICSPPRLESTAQSRCNCAVSTETCRQGQAANSGRKEYPDGRW